MKKKGFTLIELLAVIVILAIIALISTPIILGVIENAKKGSAKNSINGYMEAVELQIARNSLDSDTNNDITDGTYTVDELSTKGVKVKGTTPTGTVVIAKGQVSSGTLSVDKYEYTITDGKIDSDVNEAPVVTVYKDNSGANYPEFANTNLVPVVIDANGIVKKANLEEKWYDYNTKEWANAVVLTDNTSYNAGQEIPEDNIDAYLVWIPRYSYAVPTNNGTAYTSGNEKEILVKFVDTNIKENGTGKDGSYYTHPAFTFDNELKGIWVGKFEIGYRGATSPATAQTTSTDSTKLIVKPNTYSWRSNTVSNFFNTMLALADSYNVTDTHMMKNTEWGSVVLLTQSKYGRCTSGTCTEVGINSNSSYITGGGDYKTNVTQSTTGNITGIYDMSGGAWEYVMGNYNDTISSSGFTSMPEAKYYDKYTGTTGIKGDATNADGTSGWYGDNAGFVGSSGPLFVRGGGFDTSGTIAGVFYYAFDTGVSANSHSSRVSAITH